MVDTAHAFGVSQVDRRIHPAGANAIGSNAGASKISATSELTDPMLMIEPPPLRNNAGTANLHPRNTLRKLTAMVRSKSLIDASTTLPGSEMAALFTIVLR
jgi:hypothetical protein